jgi:tRNA(Ile)-lysidine synthase
MDILDQFIMGIKANGFFSNKDRLLLAVSGGIDSVVLCSLCKRAGYDFSIAHCNFGLRGEESERDERFVRSLAKNYDVPVYVKKFDAEKYATEKKLSVQVAARELRYEWFGELIATGEAGHFLLTAHHADDNAETILMNFLRGTGLQGLTGIPAISGSIRRPLLQFSREQLVAYAKENQLEFVEDSSNQSSKYTRNLFRNEIFPLIEKAYPQVKENLGDNIHRFMEIARLYMLTVGELKKKLCRKKGDEVHIPVKQLISFQNKALIFDIISDYGFTEKQVDEVLKLADSKSGRYIQAPESNFRIIRHRHWFIISPGADNDISALVIEEKDRSVLFPNGRLELVSKSANGFIVPASNDIAALSGKEIQFPLLLRKWKQGDYFYPLGMKKKNKIARFLIDHKLSKPQKENVWVIEMNKKIVWVVGMRIDERFKVEDNTSNILQIEFKMQNLKSKM